MISTQFQRQVVGAQTDPPRNSITYIPKPLFFRIFKPEFQNLCMANQKPEQKSKSSEFNIYWYKINEYRKSKTIAETKRKHSPGI